MGYSGAHSSFIQKQGNNTQFLPTLATGRGLQCNYNCRCTSTAFPWFINMQGTELFLYECLTLMHVFIPSLHGNLYDKDVALLKRPDEKRLRLSR